MSPKWSERAARQRLVKANGRSGEGRYVGEMSRRSTLKSDPFRYFNSSPEVIRLVVAMMYVRFPLSLRNVEDLLFERGIDLCHETVRLWWNVRAAVRRRHPAPAGGSDAGVSAVARAP